VKSRILFALVGCVGLALLPATAQAHFPYEVTPPAWWTETLGPPVTGLDGVTYTADCTVTESHTNDFGFEVYELRWLGSPEPDDDFAPCKRDWGSVRALCSGRAVHNHDGNPNPDFSFRCAIDTTPGQLGGVVCTREDSSFSGDTGWDPYDCRPDYLTGWPNNPSVPAGDSRLAGAEKASCSKRQCSFEVSCQNSTGDAGCLFALVIASNHFDPFTADPYGAFDQATDVGSTFDTGQPGLPGQVDDGQNATLSLKTTKQGRKTIVNYLRKGKKSVKGKWWAYRIDKPPESGFPQLDEGEMKIKLKR
jgi:hypothetical protein